MSEQKPAVGRIVHYVSYGTPDGEYPRECRAAIVTEVGRLHSENGGEVIGLAVANPTGMFFNRDVPYDAGEPSYLTEPSEPVLCGDTVYPGGTWHWPARS